MKILLWICLLCYAHPFWASTVKQELLSPVTTDAAPYFWTGTAITGLLLLTEDQLSDPTSKNTHDKKPLGDASKLGDLYGQVYPNALYTLGMYTHGYFSKNKLSSSRGNHMLKSSLYAISVATIIKYTAREPRPDNIKEKNSFPSGHTTTAFAFATVIATEHEWYFGVPALIMATLTAYSRMNDGRHFLHDVVAGMTIGASYGLGVHFSNKGQGENWAFAPILDLERTGIRIVRHF